MRCIRCEQLAIHLVCKSPDTCNACQKRRAPDSVGALTCACIVRIYCVWLSGVEYGARVKVDNPYTSQDSPRGMLLGFSTTQNPDYGVQHAASVAISFPLEHEEQADVSPGDAAVLKVYNPTFLTDRCLVTQTTATPGAINEITIQLSTNFRLSSDHGSQLTLTGLDQRSKPAGGDAQHLVLAGGFAQTRFFNDVFKSYNGHDWLLLAAGAPWRAREGHALLNAQALLFCLLLDACESSSVQQYLHR